MQNIKVDISLVTSLSDQELEDVTSVSNLAYLDATSPAISLLTGGKLELIPDLFRAMTLCCLMDGECYIATEAATQKIVGTALWFPPGKKLWATDESRQASEFNTFFGKLDQATKDWWVKEASFSFAFRLRVTKDDFERLVPSTDRGVSKGNLWSRDSWWLNNVAVLPEYQGCGIATSLLERVLKKAASNEAIGCMTDTEKNLKFYKSLRFKEIGILYMRHPGDGSDIKVWGFKQCYWLREARLWVRKPSARIPVSGRTMQPTHKLRGKNIAIYYKSVLLALALLCKIVVTVQLRKYMQTRIPSVSEKFPADSPAVWPANSVAPVHLAFEDSIHYGLDTPTSDAEWLSLAPNEGLIYLGDEHQVFSISMFHELRCLDIIRKGIVQTIDGNITIPTQLMQHCLNYIRQMIFCRSNTMLTGFVQSTDADKPHSFLSIQECNDWAEIFKEVERNQEDHRRWIVGDGTHDKA
ncbi:protein of unknown function (DUF3328) domain containing protein [Tylopilus felleus]